MWGILSRPLRAVSGLGAYASTIPSECWNQTGFKDCNAQQYQVAKVTCQGQGQDNDACIGPLADKLTMNVCKCKRASTAKPAVVTTKVKPSSEEEGFGPEPGIFGMDPKTLLLVGLVGVGLYMYMGGDSKKGKS